MHDDSNELILLNDSSLLLALVAKVLRRNLEDLGVINDVFILPRLPILKVKSLHMDQEDVG
jgi:hypothetical protein